MFSEVNHTLGQVLNLYYEFILWNFCKEFINCSYRYWSSLYSFSYPVLFLILNTVCHWWFANDSTSGLYESINKPWILLADDGRKCYHNLYFRYLFVTTACPQLQLHWHTCLLDSLTFQALRDVCDGNIKMNSNIYHYNWIQTAVEHSQVFNLRSPGYG